MADKADTIASATCIMVDLSVGEEDEAVVMLIAMSLGAAEDWCVCREVVAAAEPAVAAAAGAGE